MRRIVAIFALLAGCARDRADAHPDPAATAKPSPTETKEPKIDAAAERFGCKVDADCFVSCSLGAVNRAWYERAKPQECKDGCAGANVARCIEGSCVAWSLRDDGGVNDTCTRREAPL